MIYSIIQFSFFTGLLKILIKFLKFSSNFLLLEFRSITIIRINIIAQYKNILNNHVVYFFSILFSILIYVFSNYNSSIDYNNKSGMKYLDKIEEVEKSAKNCVYIYK